MRPDEIGLNRTINAKIRHPMHVHAERYMVMVGTFRVKGSMSQDVSVSEESPKKEKKKKKGLRTPSFLKKKKEKKKSVEA